MSARVPFFDVGASYRELKPRIDAACERVLTSGSYVLSKEVEAFESEFAEYCRAAHCVGVGNGLDALTLILRALRIGRGDEVLVPAHTFIATWLAVTHAGAVPVPVDVVSGTRNIDPRQIERTITPRTKAVVTVHLYGLAADMDPICEVARRYGLAIIEDAAQAHGADYGGRRVGGLADAAAFSFYPTKNLGCFGDGGAVVTNNGALAQEVRLLRNYGSLTKYQHEKCGVNSRLDSLHAAILRTKLPFLEEWNCRRRAVALRYHELLDHFDADRLVLPSESTGSSAAWHLFVIATPLRDMLQRGLAARGVETLIHYPSPPHLSGAYASAGYARGDFPRAEALAGSVLSLPIGPHLPADSVNFAAAALVEELDRASTAGRAARA